MTFTIIVWLDYTIHGDVSIIEKLSVEPVVIVVIVFFFKLLVPILLFKTGTEGSSHLIIIRKEFVFDQLYIRFDL